MKTLITLLLLTVATLGQAGQAYYKTITICEIQPTSWGVIAIRPCDEWEPYFADNGNWISWNGVTPGGRNMYAAALHAKAMNKKVMVRIVDKQSFYDSTTMIRIKED